MLGAWRNGGMNFVTEEIGQTSRKRTQTLFLPTPNPHGVTETRTRGPAVGWERLNVCATEPPLKWSKNA